MLNKTIKEDENNFKKFVGKFPYVSKGGSVVYMRSNWERLYAKYLDSMGIKWYYEPMSFRSFNGHFYHPDFYLPTEDIWIEIKGFLRKGSKQKIEYFQDRYPGKLKVLFGKDLIALGISI